MKLNRLKAQAFVFLFVALATVDSFGQSGIQLEKISTYHTGFFDESATEIVAHDKDTQRLFVTNGATGEIDILDISDPNVIVLLSSIDLSPYGKGANSVAFKNGTLAVAVENLDKQSLGKAVFFDSDGNFLNQVTTGALPDNIVFSPNGKYVLVANEGEPNDDFTIDPEGSVTIVDLWSGVQNITQGDVTQVGFTAFNNAVLDPSIRVSSNPGNSSVAQDLEPEYITVSKNSKFAWIALQENNALAKIKIKKGKVKKLIGLGFKDHSIMGNGLDASNETPGIDIQTWPIRGMYMPDAISSYKTKGKEYIVLANEGDSRDYDGYSEEVRVKDLVLDPAVFPNAALLQDEMAIGRMKTTTATGDADGDGLFEEIYTYGARSFSIRKKNGDLVYDSGDDFEQITAIELPNNFNSTNDENGSFKDRSDNKGPEPEAVEIAKIKGKYYAFIGLERVGGIMVYDITNANNPDFVQHINTRDFSAAANTPQAGDLGPEDVLFINKSSSPIDEAIIACANEVSGTITLFKVLDSNSSSSQRSDSEEPEDQLVVKEADNDLDGLILYPNPVVSGILNLSKKMDVTIYDINGRKVLSKKSVNRVDVSSLKNGLYLLKNHAGGEARILIGN